MENENSKGRQPRSDRNKEERPKSWTRPDVLPQINREEGKSYRWVRTSSMATGDPQNVSSKFREGWEPVKASEHPEAFTMPDRESQFEDSIEIGGLLLCQNDEEITRQRDAYFSDRTDANTESVDSNYLREGDARMPMFKEKSTKVSFGNGSGGRGNA
jgi:hypothetical protein|tara:strand:- start:985 stop:1458 length:474 start_codon:yes stop_codon:yes gene_type:complete